MRSTEIEINAIQFQSLGIDFSKIKENKGKRELTNSINEFLGNKKESNDQILLFLPYIQEQFLNSSIKDDLLFNINDQFSIMLN